MNVRKHRASAAVGAIAAAAALLSACAGMPPPREQLAVATAAVDSARSAGASEVAAPELAAAVSKLERARTASQGGNQLEARNLAEAAEVDAHVARSKAAAVKSQRALAEVQASNRALREQSGTPASGTTPAAPARTQ
jgi:hypothetical protein